MSLFRPPRMARHSQPLEGSDSDSRWDAEALPPAAGVTPPPVTPVEPAAAVGVPACSFCARTSADLADALEHTILHARAWRDEAMVAERQRRRQAARHAAVARDTRDRLAELESPS